MKKGLVSFLSAVEIDKIIDTLAQQIQKDYADKELTIICPLKSSVFFVSDLIRKLKIPIELDFVFIESLGKDNFRIKKDISIDIKDKNVLLAAEIIDTGLSLSFLIKHLQLLNPADLKSLVLLDKISQRKALVHLDYVGRMTDDRFIVGYGMDLDEDGRHYPDMYHLGQ